MLRIHQLTKSFEINPLFQAVTFSVLARERVGLVGPNGCGKTTLLRIIAGDESPDSGSVQRTPSDLRVGYLKQGLLFETEETLQHYLTRAEGDLPALSERIAELAMAMVATPGEALLEQEYHQTLDAIARISENLPSAQSIMGGLGLGDLPPDTPIAHLSGGQKTRLALAGILLSAPQFLLLDEPTNHLDLDMLDWLENWLQKFNGAALIVSHDRAFLDRITTAIVEMDVLTHTAKRYEGNYTAYLEQKAAERERQFQAYHDQQDEIARLRSTASHVRDIARFHKGGKADTGDKFARGFFANRALETIRRAKQLEQRIDRMMNEDRVDKPGRTWQMRMEFEDVVPSGRTVLALEDLAIGYDGLALLTRINKTVRYADRIALVGPNGAGKTTLLRTIAGRIAPIQGVLHFGANVRLGYMTQEQEHLDDQQTPLELLLEQTGKTETETRSFLSKYLFTGDGVFVPIGSLSFGERARLSLACLVAEGCNFLLLDEPINHLDIPSRAHFEQALTNFDGTSLAVVHDRYFIAGYATQLWEVRSGEITQTY